MAFLPQNPLPLADSDGVVKIIFFGLAAAVWLVVQVGSAAKASAKKNAEKLRAESQSGRPAAAGGPTRMERKLRERQLKAEQFRNTGGRVVVAAPPPQPQVRPQSYEEVRRGRQAPPDAPRPPAPARRPAPKPQPQPKPQRRPAPAAAPAFAGGRTVNATEIGDASPRKSPGQSRGGRNAALSLMLRSNSLRNLIAAGEILRPPVALRDADDRPR